MKYQDTARMMKEFKLLRSPFWLQACAQSFSHLILKITIGVGYQCPFLFHLGKVGLNNMPIMLRIAKCGFDLRWTCCEIGVLCMPKKEKTTAINIKGQITRTRGPSGSHVSLT